MTSSERPEASTHPGRHVVSDTTCYLLLVLPHYSDTGSTFSSPQSSYQSLGHCLRSNIFPGPPLEWRTLFQESYIPPLQAPPPPTPPCWYGRRTDDLVRWTEKNIVSQKMKKSLQQMEGKGRK